MRLADFKVLTFDTYGTLIDWEAGIVAALEPLLARLPRRPSPDAVLERFAEAENAQEAATPAMVYSDLLAATQRTLAQAWGVAPDDAEARAFGASVGAWPAFEDSREALAYLGRHFTLITLTNCDRSSYRGSDERLGHPWDAIITAQDVGSYKPARANFDALLDLVRRDFGRDPEAILHVAQSLFHDHAPAMALGLTTCWIDRRHTAEGGGATKPPPAGFDPARIAWRFTSMAELAAAHRAETGG